MSLRFSTNNLDRRSQLSYWHDVVCATFVRLGLERPERRAAGFRAEVTAQRVGDLQLATVISDPHAVFRSPAMIRVSPEDHFMVNLAVSGRTVVIQEGREAVLRPGDFAIHDSARPCRIACPDRFRMVVLKVPRDIFISRCQLPSGSTAVAVAGDRGAGALFSGLLCSLPAHTADLRPEVAGQVGATMLGLLATAMSELTGDGRTALPRQAQLLRARRYIANHLSDPDLSPSLVAEALGVSVRYLYLLFQTEASSPARWILQLRLERAADLLADQVQASRSITDIAFGVGFKDISHFSRAFKDLHGVSPREYRRRCDPAVST